MCRLFTILILFGLFGFSNLLAQDINYENILPEELVEDILSETDDNSDLTTIFSDLSEYLINKLNINEATSDELNNLHLLNDFQINSLLDYRKKNGELLSIFELQYVYGFNQELIKKILPFISVNPAFSNKKINIKDAIKYGRQSLFIRPQQVLETQAGYTSISDSLLLLSPNSRYIGSPLSFYSRYKFQYKQKILFGLTVNKDPGEQFFNNNIRGFDYYSVHLQINDIGKIKTIILGDYHAKFGQGLAIWSGLSFGKSSYVMQVKKYANGLQKYSSSDENKFLRGVGTTINFGKIDFSIFASQKNIDANIILSDSINNVPIEFSSFQQTGYHRTLSEIADRKSIGEKIIGTHIEYRKDKLKLGVTAVDYLYNALLIPNNQINNKFAFSGNNCQNISVDFDWQKKNINLFGETAMNNYGGYATLNGLQIDLLTDVYLSLIYRDYSKDYFSPYSNSLAENNKTNNEKGIYSGIQINSIKNFTITAYYDQFSFPWLTYIASSPSKGYEYLFQINYYLNSQFEAYVQYKNETKESDYTSSYQNTEILENREKERLRFNFSYLLTPNLRLQNRVEYSNYSLADNIEKGYMVYQDISRKFNKLPISCALRYIIFDTDGYNSRIYLYENDLLYNFSFPALYDKGTRTYILLKYAPSKSVFFQIKYGITVYSNKDKISSGLSEIQTNKKSELKGQIVLKF